MLHHTIFAPYKGLRKEIYIIALARIVNAMGAFIFPLMTLILTDKIGLSTAQSGEILFVFSILYLPASLIGGKLTDLMGRMKIIVIMDLMAIGLYLLCAFIPVGMVTVYLILGAAVCLFMADPAHTALISDYTTSETREAAFSLAYMGWNLGFAVGPMIAGFLYKRFFIWIFIGDALTALLSLSLLILFVREVYHGKDKEHQEQLEGHEKVHHGGSIQVLRERPILLILPLLLMTFQFSYSQWGFIMPMQVNALYGPELYGLLASFNGLVVILCTPLLTKVMAPYKHIAKIVGGGLLYVAGFGLLGIIHTQMAFFISVLIFTLGEIVLAISFYPFMMNFAPANHRGRISAVVNNISGMGSTLGPLVMGKFLLFYSISSGWLFAAGVSALGALLIIFVQMTYLRKLNLHPLVEMEENH